MATVAAPPSNTLTTTDTAQYIAPAKAIVEITLVNIDGVNPVYATVSWNDNSASNAKKRLAFQQLVPPNDGVTLASKVLELNDAITAFASAANSVDMTVNVLWLDN